MVDAENEVGIAILTEVGDNQVGEGLACRHWQRCMLELSRQAPDLLPQVIFGLRIG